MFQLVIIEPGLEPRPYLVEFDGEMKPIVYTTGKEAAERAKSLSAVSGFKVQPRPIADDAWIARERSRFDAGEYLTLPDWFPTKPDHYTHHATGKAGMVSFTEDAIKGAADRQTRIKPGAYVARFFPELSSDEVTALSQRFAGEFEDNSFKLATTADEIERVYVNGPSSCMSHSADRYNSSEHPVRVYAAGDLAIAYLEDEDGDITARTVCWPERKQRAYRIYGDYARLNPLLINAGYRESDLSGAKLLRIENGDDQFIAPYLDGCRFVSDSGEFLVIGRGDIQCGGTDGLTEENGQMCPRCEELADEDSFSTVIVGSRGYEEYWCVHCIDNHTFYCDGNNEIYSDDVDHVTTADGSTYCQSYADENGFFTCDGDGDVYGPDEMVTLHNGTVWSSAYFADHGFQCEDCGECFANDDMHDHYPGVCQSCGEDRAQGELELEDTDETLTAIAA